MGSTTVYIIGRGETNDIVIDDPSISREHAELRRKNKDEFTLVDLNSTNGTCVRDGSKWVEIESATVDAGERVLIGEVVTTVDALLSESRRTPMVPAADRPSILGFRLPSLSRPSRPDTPTNGRRSQLDRQAQRLTDTDIAQLVGPYRSGRVTESPDLESPVAGSPITESTDQSGPLPADAVRLVPAAEATMPVERPAAQSAQQEARPEPRLTHLSHEAENARGQDMAAAGAPMDEPVLPAPSVRGGDLPGKPAAPSFAGLPSADEPAPEIDSSSIVLDRRGSFRASPPRNRWDPPREQRGPGQGVSKWVALTLGLIFLGSAAAAGVVVYTTKAPDKASKRNGASPAMAAKKPANKKPAATPAKSAAPPAAQPPSARVTLDTIVRRAVAPVEKPTPEKTRASKPARPVEIAALGRAGPTYKPGARFWARTYAGKARRQFRAIAPAKGGGAFAAGSAYDPATGDSNAWLVRLDSYGNVIWQKIIGGAGDDHALALVRTRDGGVVVAGSVSQTGGQAVWIARFDKVGERLWERRVPTLKGGHATGIVRAGRGFAVSALNRTPNGPRSLLIRLGADGAVLWSQQIGDSYTWATGLARVRRGFLLVGVARQTDAGPRTLWAMRTDRKGNRMWQRYYPRAGGSAATAYVRPARRRTFIIATTHEVVPGPNLPPTIANARVVRIKRSGDVVWDHLMQTPLPDRVAGMVLQKGGIVLAGATFNGQGNSQDLWVARMNTDGNVAWQRRYGGGRQDHAAAVAEGKRGVLYLAGSSSQDRGRGWVLKLDRRGRLSP